MEKENGVSPAEHQDSTLRLQRDGEGPHYPDIFRADRKNETERKKEDRREGEKDKKGKENNKRLAIWLKILRRNGFDTRTHCMFFMFCCI